MPIARVRASNGITHEIYIHANKVVHASIRHPASDKELLATINSELTKDEAVALAARLLESAVALPGTTTVKPAMVAAPAQ